MRNKSMWPVALGAAGILVQSCGSTLSAPPSEADLAKMMAAAPAKASAVPTKKRRLLVYIVANGFVHSSRETGARAMEILGQKTGAWETVVSNDTAALEPDNLKTFDAVCFLNTTGDVFMPKDFDKLPDGQKATARARAERMQKGLVDFVSGGKGFIGVHSATDTLYNWTGYGELIGGYFDGHPWNAGDDVSVRIEDPGHPVTRHLNGEALNFKEEIYQFKEPYDRSKQRVLMGLDLAKSMKKDSLKRKDNDYAVTWIKNYGAGRVFYTSLGHREDKFSDPKVLGLYLSGIQFALGDLKADATPIAQTTANPTASAAAQPAGLEQPASVSDAVLGEYSNLTGIEAKIYPEGDNNYRAVLLQKNTDGSTKRTELTGKLENNAIAFTGDGAEGRWSDNKFAATFANNKALRYEFKKSSRISPTLALRPPAGAVVLLPFVPGAATNLGEWTNQNWVLMSDGSVRVQGGDNKTKREFGDIKLHIEWMTPLMPSARGQGRGNSGVYLQDRYEVQVLDSFGLDSKDNDAGGLYKVSKPRTNASLPPGVWQTYDITFRAPRLNADGSMAKKALITILHNGIVIQENVELENPTGGGANGLALKAPIKLQDHSNPVRYRNIWVQELSNQG